MKKNERFRRVLCLLLAAVMLAGFALPAAAVGADPEIRFDLEQIDNRAVTAEPLNKMGDAKEPAANAADMDELVRVTIHLEKEPTIGAGFGLKGIGTNVSAMSYRQNLHREQEKLQKTIERRVLSGRQLDVVWNLTLAANLISVNVPRWAIAEIGKLDGVQSVVEERRYAPDVVSIGGTYSPDMAVSGQMTGADHAWLSGYTGAGSRVAIIDTGLDTDHQSFSPETFRYALDESGEPYSLMDSTDIAAVLTQLNAYRKLEAAGTPLSAHDLYFNAKTPYGFNYVDGDLNISHDFDDMGSHGSHVAGIAAGVGGIGGQPASYKGIAPGADIVLVATTLSSAAIFDGINYIRNYAASQNKPCVINMSLGSHVGPHDGTSSFDRACDDLFLARPDSLLLVGSAGNEGADNLHVGKAFTATDTILMTLLDFTSPASGECVVDLWGAPNVPFKAGLAVVDMSSGQFVDAGSYFLSSTSYYDNESLLSNQLQLEVYSSGTSAYNQRQNLTFSISYSNAANTNYRVCLVVQCNSAANVHVWGTSVNFIDGGYSAVLAGNTDYTVGELGGTGHHMISVGAYTSRSSWNSLSGYTYTYPGAIVGNLAGFSSHGPLLDGRVKPDITAPGQFVVAPFNRFNTEMTSSSYCVASTTFNGQTEYYGALQGTSMAAPMVTGVMALWMQHNPALGPDSALALLHSTAIADGATGTIPATGSNLWGWGKINALGGLPSTAPVTYTLTVASNNEAYGTVSGSGTYAEGTSATITATPANGYHFVSWDDGNTDNPRTVTVNTNLNFIAIFEQDAFQECDTVTSFPWNPTFSEALPCWRNVDADADGYLWTNYGAYAVSESYAYFDHSNTALDPDNWLISRPLRLPQNALLSWTAKALTNEYFAEHYSVYISTTGNEPANFTTRLFQETLPNPNAQNHSVSLARYAGQTVRIAFRHHQSPDVLLLGITAVSVKQAPVGIDDASLADALVAAQGRAIRVEVPAGTPVRVTDVMGRTLVDLPSSAASQLLPMPAPGVYMVSLGDNTTRKVVVY